MLYFTFVLWYEREAAVFFCVEQEEAIIARAIIMEILYLRLDIFNLVQSFHMTLRSNEFLQIEGFVVRQIIGFWPLAIGY